MKKQKKVEAVEQKTKMITNAPVLMPVATKMQILTLWQMQIENAVQM